MSAGHPADVRGLAPFSGSLTDVVECRFGPNFLGGDRRGVTPVPMPNTVVKPSTADGTARVTVWESRSLPGFFQITR